MGMGGRLNAAAGAASVLLLLASGAFSQTMPQALGGAAPGFAPALVAAAQRDRPPARDAREDLLELSYGAARAGRPLPDGATPETLADAYLRRALSGPEALREACDYLAGKGIEGRAAAARLRERASAASSDPRTPPPTAPLPGPAAPPSLDSIRSGTWDDAGSRAAFDGGSARGDVPAESAAPPPPSGAAATPSSDPSPTPPSGLSASPNPNLPDFLTKPAPPGSVKIVSVGMEKLQEIAQRQIYQERKESLQRAFGVGGGASIGGGGFFTAKILSPKEVAADADKQRARDDAARRGERIVFVRTTTHAQIFGGKSIPIEIPAGGAPAPSASFGLSLGGFVEIVETRAVPEERAGAAAHAEQRVFLWPLTAEHLRRVLRPGEDLTITGRLDAGAAVGAGVGAGLGLSRFAHVGASAGAGVGKAADLWITLRVKKTDSDHVRILVQRGDGETLSANVQASAGLNLYDDSFIPRVTPTTLEEGLVGKAVIGGEKGLLRQIQDLASAQISASWSEGRSDVDAEGWASVPLSDTRVAGALDSFFKFNPEALRSLPPGATFSEALRAGRLRADVRDITNNASFQAHLSKLKLAFSGGTEFYEMRWRRDGDPPKRYIVGIARSRFHGDVTKTNRAEESVMWYDLDTGRAAVTVTLGPQNRLFTTTREKINDVIATQRALGARITGRIDEPDPYLQFFGLGNYGRSVENGLFYLSDDGIQSLKRAARDRLIAAYLHADWLYERESWPPGEHFWDEPKPPVWADAWDPAAFQPALDFLRANAAEVQRQDGGNSGDESGPGSMAWLEAEYRKVAPGRWLREDARRYVAAGDYANRVGDMQRSDTPEQLIELFLRLRRDGNIDLKRAVVATAFLSGEHAGPDGRPAPNWQGYLEMTGSRVELRPAGGPPPLPVHPVQELNSAMGTWQ